MWIIGTMKNKHFQLFALLFACALAAACSIGGQRHHPADFGMRWPLPAATDGIAWVGSIRTPADAGITRNWWQKLSDFITGADEAFIGRPYGVFADERNRLFIADPGLGVVHVMDRQENRYWTIGQGAGKPFQTPIAIAGDGRENLYITDSTAGLVYRYGLQDGTLHPFVHLQRPTGISFNRRNQLLYITDTLAHRVKIFDLAGNELFRIGGRGEGEGELNYPTDLFSDAQGRVYVTDPLNGRIQIFTMEGHFLRTVGAAGDAPGDFFKPKGVAVDGQGRIYVCDALLDAVHALDASGLLLMNFGSRGGNAGEFWMPSGIYIDAGDTIYVADTWNQRVQVFRLSPDTAEEEKL